MDQELIATAASGQQDTLADEEADSASLPERDAEVAVSGDLDRTVGRLVDDQEVIHWLYLQAGSRQPVECGYHVSVQDSAGLADR
ncbi:hypothetical protein GV791_28700 [Nocardia cyriacigeorgica]|uniref:Uncharacterized protein n=1 Tax=Nocardia cyriacigeorgica TaxID=135487 RepID=A0A6P1CVA1_9NOCA|nr:hypothetical protein [Nocardia cyriacigeorgica]NEW36508.1 hypothetical protein [Nocardia cyriacigeorgica]